MTDVSKEGSSEKKRLRMQNIIVIAVILILVITVGILVYLNMGDFERRKQFQIDEIFVIKIGEAEHTVTMDLINEIGVEDFKATKKTSGKAPQEVLYQGISLVSICDKLSLDISGYEKCIFSASDGFFSSADINEVLDEENVWIAVGMGGQPLGKMDDGGDGSYMMVIRKALFSQNWCKYLYEVEFK